MWQTEQEEKRNQSIILYLVSKNSVSRKAKQKIETHHAGIERLINMLALKLIARQKANKKAQLKE